MTIHIGNAPCSWGVEFSDDPRNPPWEQVLAECAGAGFTGIELGPVGYLPEDISILKEALDRHQLSLIGGVVYRAFHDGSQWQDIKDGTIRTCESLAALGAKQLVLIDSISPERARTAGRGDEAPQLDASDWHGFVDRFQTMAKIGAEEYGLTVGVHAHAGGHMEFQGELERLLGETDEKLLKICLDTGHFTYAGGDPVRFLDSHMDRISYIHFKDIDPAVKETVIRDRTDFYEACAQGMFCRLGEGVVDFAAARQVLLENQFDGWCTVEQDCDPQGATSPIEDAKSNRHYLQSIGFN